MDEKKKDLIRRIIAVKSGLDSGYLPAIFFVDGKFFISTYKEMDDHYATGFTLEEIIDTLESNKKGEI